MEQDGVLELIVERVVRTKNSKGFQLPKGLHCVIQSLHLGGGSTNVQRMGNKAV